MPMSILSLPCEVLRQIAQELGPDRMVPPDIRYSIGDTRGHGDQLALARAHSLPSAAIRDSMYRSVFPHNWTSMALLMRTLAEGGDNLRGQVRHMTLNFSRPGWDQNRDDRNADNFYAQNIDHLRRLPGGNMSKAIHYIATRIKTMESEFRANGEPPSRNGWRMPKKIGILAVLLCMVPRLEILEVKDVTSMDQIGLDHPEIRLLCSLLRSLPLEPNSRPLLSVRELRIHGSTLEPSLTFWSEFGPLCPNVVKATALGLCCWFEEPNEPMSVKGYQEFALEADHHLEEAAVIAARQFTSLKKFTLTVNPRILSWTTPGGPKNLDMLLRGAIYKMRRTLEELYLVTPWGTAAMQRLTYGGGLCLGSLRGLDRLRYLHIEIGALCKKKEYDGYSLASNLPASLESLELVGGWEGSYQGREGCHQAGVPRQALMGVVRLLRVQSAEFLPNLRRFRLLVCKPTRILSAEITSLRDEWTEREMVFDSYTLDGKVIAAALRKVNST